ncbi:MAG TPA: ABC transporter permease [Candidatus Saccharimonadales bacterium]|nr:ABC transporter permease [Candidatus Saccharimonadales bacterium]
MAAYIIRRLLIAIPIMFGITILIFVFVALAPGDAVDAYLRPEQAGDAALRAAITHALGLDQPLPIRYLDWLAATLQGNLGFAALTGEPVNAIVWRGLLASGSLMLTALAIGIVIGIPIGALGALRQYSKLDSGITAFAFLGISTPSFLAALGGLYLFGVLFPIFPVGGMQAAAVPFTIPDFLAHLTLPALILGFGYVAQFSRYTRSSMLEVISQLYITTAVSKGLPSRTVVVRHAFRNALIPVVTIIGLSLPSIIGGAAVTEYVFAWPGLGWAVINAANQRDFPTIMGISLCFAVVVLIANLLTDVTYALIDPRIRY